VVTRGRGTPPGNLHGYQSTAVTGKALCKSVKTKGRVLRVCGRVRDGAGTLWTGQGRNEWGEHARCYHVRYCQSIYIYLMGNSNEGPFRFERAVQFERGREPGRCFSNRGAAQNGPKSPTFRDETWATQNFAHPPHKGAATRHARRSLPTSRLPGTDPANFLEPVSE